MTAESNSRNQLVSIIMPAFNAEKFISSAIDSVVNQTYKDWELLIVDDGSKDSTVRLASQYASEDQRIKVFCLNENSGVVKARNRALDEAEGKYIAFLDSDDCWLPDKLETQVKLMQSEDINICFSPYQCIDEQDKHIREVFPPKTVNYPTLLKSNFIGNLTGIYNAELLGKQYFTNFKHEDYVAWLALVKKAGLAVSADRVLAKYRITSGSISSNKLKTISWQWNIYRNSESLGLVYSVWLMTCYAYYALSKRL